MFWLKACPRCSGDLYQDLDQYGPFVSCLQCGLSKDVSSEPGEGLQFAALPVALTPLPQLETGKHRRISHGGRHFAKTIALGAGSSAQSAA